MVSDNGVVAVATDIASKAGGPSISFVTYDADSPENVMVDESRFGLRDARVCDYNTRDKAKLVHPSEELPRRLGRPLPAVMSVLLGNDFSTGASMSILNHTQYAKAATSRRYARRISSRVYGFTRFV